MNSGKLKSMLEYAQAAKLRPLGERVGASPLTQVLKDLGFAKQRFDSTVDPAAKLALQLIPVAVVLAIIAGDMRNTKERRGYAERAFRFLGTKFASALGISGDWGIVWEVLLRLFDVDDHDIAASSEQVEAHIQLLRALFLQGGVFDTRTWGAPLAATLSRSLKLPPKVVHCMGEAGVTGCFLTEHVAKQVARPCEFNVAGKPVVLWGSLGVTEKQELGERLQNATAVGIERLEADLLGQSHLRQHLRCFHIPLIQKVFGPSAGPGDSPIQPHELKRSFRELWQMLKLPFGALDAGTEEYAKLATMFACATLPGGKLYGKTNRKVWACCLDLDYMAKVSVGRPAPFQHIFPVVRLYMAILDGTVRVERYHGLIRGYLEETQGKPALALVEDVVTVRCSKTRLDDMATLDGICRGELGDFGLACAKQWREVFGARLGIGRAICKGDAIFKGSCASKQAGSFKQIKKGVLKAAGIIARFKSPSSNSTRSIFRLSRGHALGGPQPGGNKNKFWNPGPIAEISALHG